MSENKAFPEKILQSYNKERLLNVQRKLCHAPFQNLYFGRDGKITACCYNRRVILGQYPTQNLIEIWTSDVTKSFRAEMTSESIGTGCDYCADQLQAGNIAGLHANIYDRYADAPLQGIYQKIATITRSGSSLHTIKNEALFLLNKTKKLYTNRNFFNLIKQAVRQEFKQRFRFHSETPAQGTSLPETFPRSMEFELSNICNLECTMCFGDFSSSIRKNRDQLPPLPMYYDAAFVEQLEPFLPHLWDAKFYGGEPFLVPIYYDIWERMIQINPNITIHITTNGTILNEKVKRLLNKLNVLLILSIDSFEKETYEAIRKNASYERVMENMKYFEKVAEEKQGLLNLAVCPMTLNWQEIPRIVQYCNEKGMNIYFNTVWYPLELSLRSLSSDALQSIIIYYEKMEWTSGNFITNKNINAFKSYVNQVKKWQEQVMESERANEEKTRRIAERLELLQHNNPLFSALSNLNSDTEILNQNTDYQKLREQVSKAESAEKFIISYFETLCEAIHIYADETDKLQLEINKSNIRTLCDSLLMQLPVAEIVERIIYNNHEHTAKYIQKMQLDEEKDITNIFGSFNASIS